MAAKFSTGDNDLTRWPLTGPEPEYTLGKENTHDHADVSAFRSHGRNRRPDH